MFEAIEEQMSTGRPGSDDGTKDNKRIRHLAFFASLELASKSAKYATDQSLKKSAMYSFVPGLGYLTAHSIWKVAKYTAISLAVHNPIPFFVFLGESCIKYGGVYGAWFMLKSGVEKNVRDNFDVSKNEAVISFYRLDGIENLAERYEKDVNFQHEKDALVTKLLPMTQQKLGLLVDENASYEDLGKSAFTLSELGVLYLLSINKGFV
ncbi:MAG: hypothetical protein HRU09_17075 [Oligoflexales bacterium]|nr:hypothetical protein [Oligoflexales bacterium]